jgi:acetoin utilization deacetylase AcuC-like enzyme
MLQTQPKSLIVVLSRGRPNLQVMKTTIYTHNSGLNHDTGFSHPERAERLTAVFSVLDGSAYAPLPRGDVYAASEEQILRAHPMHYIDHIRDSVPDRGHAQIDDDTILSPGSWAAALHAAGAVCAAVDDVATGKTTRAFCAMRPPGHHAEPATSMGFCLFNNIFIGARHAQEAHGLQKIAIVDFDVHHGNGTDAMTRRHNGSILFISTHQYPLWPMTGLEEDNDESVLNFTLPPDSGSERFRTLYENKVFPALNRFAPDLLMISAGFDAHRDDPLAQLNLTEDDFTWVTRELAAIANTHCKGQVISVLEGGYNLDALKTCVDAHLSALIAD